jgi:hypothetical protein
MAMARKRNKFSLFLSLAILALAAYGGWVLYHHHDVQQNLSKVSKAAKAAQNAW